MVFWFRFFVLAFRAFWFCAFSASLALCSCSLLVACSFVWFLWSLSPCCSFSSLSFSCSLASFLLVSCLVSFVALFFFSSSWCCFSFVFFLVVFVLGFVLGCCFPLVVLLSLLIIYKTKIQKKCIFL